MASAAISKPREVTSPLPRGTSGDNRLSASISTLVTVTIEAPADDGGIAVETIGKLPPRSTHLYLQARQCGDWYCEIKADRYVAAIGVSRREACENALRKAGGSLA